MLKDLVRIFIPALALDWYHFILAFVGAVVYGFPSRRIMVIGVTGTNGKSTVVEMCDLVLREAGYRVASISSIRFKIGGKEWKNDLKMTMPGRFGLQRFLREAAKAGCQYAILEVTSEGIKQHRHRFVDFDAAVLTNLTPEHIEAHGSFEKYREAKGKLFKALKPQITNSKSQTNHKSQILNSKQKKVSIVNLDDENAEYFLGFAADKQYGYRLADNKEQTYRTFHRSKHLDIVEGKILGMKPLMFKVGNSEFILHLFGEFNVSNALAAICVGLSQDIELVTIKKALEKMRVISGRMEVVIREPFTVIVDYAHTPDALIKVYESIKVSSFKLQASKKLICVLGAAGGGRDKWKRPELGKIAAQYCDEIILTNEDPYDENPQHILDDIEKGISSFKFQVSRRQKILDRREAITFALKTASPGNTVVITGKGSEPWMCVAGGRKIPWDDRKVVREEAAKISRG